MKGEAYKPGRGQALGNCGNCTKRLGYILQAPRRHFNIKQKKYMTGFVFYVNHFGHPLDGLKKHQVRNRELLWELDKGEKGWIKQEVKQCR